MSELLLLCECDVHTSLYDIVVFLPNVDWMVVMASGVGGKYCALTVNGRASRAKTMLRNESMMQLNRTKYGTSVMNECW